MNNAASLISVLGPAVITGFFGIILYKLQSADADRKENRRQSDQRMARIEANTAKLTAHEKIMRDLTETAGLLRESTEANGEGVKIIMRYMLQRYHAEYMLQGFITSHQKTEFLEAYAVYHAKGGNGTASGWKEDVCGLPVRDSETVVNPYLEVLRKSRKAGG